MVPTRLGHWLAMACALLTALAGAAWLLPRVSSAAQAWLSAPPTRARTVVVHMVGAAPAATGNSGDALRAAAALLRTSSAAQALGGPVDAGLCFNMAGAVCRVPAVQSVHLRLSLRWSLDGQRWSAWSTVAVEPDGRAFGRLREVASEPIWAGDARYLEYGFVDTRPGSAAAVDALGDVRFVFINSTGTASLADRLANAARRAVAAVAGWRLMPRAAANTTTPAIVTRHMWGANEAIRAGGTPSYAPVKLAFVHHTDNGNNYTRAQAPALVRGIYYYHAVTLGWSDIGYNFLIDRYGTIYEGRYGGMTLGTIGAQTLGFNTGSTGIALIGTFQSVRPPAAAIVSLEKLLAWKLDVHHIDPLGTARLLCRYGEKWKTGQIVTFHTIAGHRDACYTDCPGNVLYAMLPSIRKAVAGIGLPKIYDFSLSTSYVSPNGDGLLDNITVAFTNSEQAKWTLDVRSAGGTVVRDFAGTGSAVRLVWDGSGPGGAHLPDGVYRAVASASSARGVARQAIATVVIDRVAPAPPPVTLTPATFSPNRDGYQDACVIGSHFVEPGTARVMIYSGSKLVRVVRAWTPVASGLWNVAWDGLVNGAGGSVAAPEGDYVVQVEFRDRADNGSVRRVAAVVDRTLGFLRVAPTFFSPNNDGKADAGQMRFVLTRRAQVSIAVAGATGTVRTFALAWFDAGPHVVTWDGRDAKGVIVPDGTYRIVATAQSPIGVVATRAKTTVDDTRPTVVTPTSLAAALGAKVRFAYRVQDSSSDLAEVIFTLKTGAGATVSARSPGWEATQVLHIWYFTPPKRGTYSITVRAIDRALNPALPHAAVPLVVK
jgi:hypothetical protein